MTLSNLALCCDTQEGDHDEVTIKCAKDNLAYPALITGDLPLMRLALSSASLFGMEQHRSDVTLGQGHSTYEAEVEEHEHQMQEAEQLGQQDSP